MGMFDYVNFKMPCPKCGSEIHGWQTKDSACYLDTVEPDSVNNFYAPCNQCKAWIDFTRHIPEDKPHRETPLTAKEVLAMGFAMRIDEE